MRHQSRQQNPDPIDALAGRRLRQAREAGEIGRKRLADMFQISWQQIQKYETGTDRISASRLYRFARTLNVPVAYFFGGAGGQSGSAPHDDDGILHGRETRGLLRACYKIADPRRRRKILELVRAMAAEPPTRK